MAINGVAKRELKLFIVNESKLYSQRQSIEANVARKMLSGKYDPRLAPKPWLYWVDAGARLYCKTYARPSDLRAMFPKPLRESLAKDFANIFGAEVAQELRNGIRRKGWPAAKAAPKGRIDSRLPQPYLCDYKTGARIRRSTAAEAKASRAAAGPFGGPGVISVRGRAVFVEG